MDVTATMQGFQAVQSALQVLTALQLTATLWPQQATVQDGDTFDYIVVGCGTAGSVIANRLTEINYIRVLCIEAGGDPPLESILPGLFPFQSTSYQDWGFKSEADGRTGFLLKNQTLSLNQGKMLGGSSSLDHMLHVRGNPEDYNSWAKAASDDSWSFNGLYEYFLKTEHLTDPEILHSPYRNYHGTHGYLKIRRQLSNVVLPYLDAFRELGNQIVLDVDGDYTLGYTVPLLTISDLRGSSAYAYLTPIKDRSNLFVLKNATVTEIIFKDKVAVGVKIDIDDEESITVNANKEIIVTAGAYNSPKLLMLSGIGPKKHLKSLGIDVISNLPVGKNYQDHLLMPILYKMEQSNASVPPSDPRKYPIPIFTGYATVNKFQTYPDYQVMGAPLPHDSETLILFCSAILGYQDEVCQRMSDANVGRNILFSLYNMLHPKSRGKVSLRSKDPEDPPIIQAGVFSDRIDLQNNAKFADDYNKVINTKYFKNVGAELVDLEVPQCVDFELGTKKYWECYALSMSASAWHGSGTCSLGTVVDCKLKVKGVKNLRVADSSVIPKITSGNIKESVYAIAEKAADMIKSDLFELSYYV